MGWDRVADVVVIGSGASGLTAATLAADGDAEGPASTVAAWNANVERGAVPMYDRGTVRSESQMSGSFPTPTTLRAPVATPPDRAIDRAVTS